MKNLALAGLAGSLGLALIGTAAVASAQEAAPPALAGPAAHDLQGARAHGEARAQRVHDALNLRPDQEGAWSAYRAELQAARPGHEDRRHESGDHAQLTTPERLDRIQQRMVVRQAAFGRAAAATRRFYAQLDPGQQKAFDAAGALRGGHGHFGGHGGIHHDGARPQGPADRGDG